MKFYVFFVFGILVETSFGGVIESKNRDGKVLPFPFVVVSFPNVECKAGSGSMTTTGVCYSKKQCKNMGGIELGASCSQGFGVCCAITLMCPADGGSVTVKTNLTTISGTGGTQQQSTMRQDCNFVIPKQKDVCQVRLDFIRFQLGYYKHPPVTEPGDPFSSQMGLGDCINDKLMISPTQNLPDGMVICGDASNQHLYLHYGDYEKITLSLKQMTMWNYDIKVTMIKCNSELKAPQGCTQYFQKKDDTVMSFNYPNMQLNNQKYSVCIDNNTGGKRINWRGCTPNGDTPFFISGMAAPNSSAPPMKGSDCSTDYIIIPGSQSERYCGNIIKFETNSQVIPFSMWVNFDDSEVPKELFPTDRINPMTGCPFGFTCSLIPPLTCGKGDPNSPIPDPSVGTCSPPIEYVILMDNYNIGFCLQYTIAA